MKSVDVNSSNGQKDVGIPSSSSVHWLKGLWDRFVRFLAEREYRPLYHAVAVLVIIVCASFLFYKSFPPHGTLMYTDMTWPSSLSHLQYNTAHAWMPYGSYPIGAGGQLFFYWIYPSAGLANLLHISASGYMFIMFLGTFSLAGISMYALAYSTITSLKLPNTARYAPYVGAVLAGLIFMYNPFSLTYLRAYFSYPVYALLPLLFLAMVKTFDSPSARNVILFSLFVVLVSTSYFLVWFWGLFFSYLLFFVATNRFKWQKVKDAGKVLAGTVALYFLLGATWIMPYLGSQIAHNPIRPYYAPSFSQAMVFSGNNTLMNNFRLVSVWAWTLDVVKGGVFLEILVFALPVLAILSFLVMRKYVSRNRTITYWAVVGVLGLLLATGTAFFLKRYFLYFTQSAPGHASYGWMLRVTERWLFFVPIFFALLIGIFAAYLLEKNPGGRRKAARLEGPVSSDETGKVLRRTEDESPQGERFSEEQLAGIERSLATRRYQSRLVAAAALIVLVVVSLCPVTLWFAKVIYSPVDVPKDYRQVNDYLAGQPDGDRVAWMPFYQVTGFTYKWAPKDKVIGPYSILSSPPSLSSIQYVMDPNSYFNWLESLYSTGGFQPVQFLNPEMVPKDEMSRLLAPFATRYLVFDKSETGLDFGKSLQNEKSLKLVYETKYLRVYRTDYDVGYISAATTTAKVNSFFENLSVTQALSKEELGNLAFFDGASYFGGASTIPEKYGVVDINRYLIPLTINGDFEKVDEKGQPPGWYLPFQANQKTSMSVVRDTRAKGKRSLKVVNESAATFDTGLVTTWEEPPRAGDLYTFQTSMKYRNVQWSLAAIEGYRPDTQQWTPLIGCPTIQSGDSGWTTYKCSLRVPEGFTRIRPLLKAGWAKDASRGPGVTWFDDVRLSKVNNEFISAITQKETPPRITYQRVNGEKYRVRVQGAKRPFVLVLGETYDGLWEAETASGKKIASVPMYKTINGFPIDQTGSFELTVSYRLRPWLTSGFAISFSTIFVCVLLLLYFWRKRLMPIAAGAWKRIKVLGGPIRDRIEQPPPRKNWYH